MLRLNIYSINLEQSIKGLSRLLANAAPRYTVAASLFHPLLRQGRHGRTTSFLCLSSLYLYPVLSPLVALSVFFLSSLLSIPPLLSFNKEPLFSPSDVFAIFYPKMAPTVVILGGAYGGLQIAHSLLKNNKEAKVVLVSKVRQIVHSP